MRDGVENAVDVIVAKDATTSAGPEGTAAAYTNHGFIETEVTETDEIGKRLRSSTGFRTHERS